MKFETVKELLDGVPYTKPENAIDIYNTVLREKPKRILELGHAKGVSTVYMAAALQELGEGGQIDTVDLTIAKQQEPNLETLAERAGVSDYIKIHREENTYNWWLKREIEKNSSNGRCVPMFDFCYFDGVFNWTVTGLSFFLVDKLLKANGWLGFNGYNWSYEDRLGRGKTRYDGMTIRELCQEQLEQRPIPLIMDLLVMQQPGYANFRVHNDVIAWAQKLGDSQQTL